MSNFFNKLLEYANLAINNLFAAIFILVAFIYFLIMVVYGIVVITIGLIFVLIAAIHVYYRELTEEERRELRHETFSYVKTKLVATRNFLLRYWK